MIVQVDERTDLLGYRLQCGAVPYKPNLRVSKPTTLPVSTTLRRNSVFSQQCTVSHTPPIPNSLWTIANKQSVVKQSTNSRVSSQALFLGLLAFPPGLRQSARARFRYRPDLFQFCRPLPSACISRSFRPFFFVLFLVNSMVKNKSVPLLRRLRQLLLLQCLCQSPLKPHVSPATRLRRCRRTSTRRMSTDGLLG